MEEYVRYIHNDLPSRGRVNKKEYPYLRKKLPLCSNIKHFNIAPKVDGKSQRRVQCSIKMSVLNQLESFETFPGGKLWGSSYKRCILSPKRNDQRRL